MGRTSGEADDGLTSEAMPRAARMTVAEMRAVRGIGWAGDLSSLRDDPVELIDLDDL